MRKHWFEDLCYYHPWLTVILIFLVISLPVGGGIYAYYNQFYQETEPIIMEVTNTRHYTTTSTTIINKVPHVTVTPHYKIYAEDCEFSVSSSVYNSISIGDRIVVNKIYRYKKKDNSLVKIYYEYAGE